MPPKRSAAVASSASTSLVLRTSTGTASALPPAAVIASATGSTSCGSPGNQPSTTFAPARANSVAVAAPMPDAAPVTTAVLPSRRNIAATLQTAPLRWRDEDSAQSRHRPRSARRLLPPDRDQRRGAAARDLGSDRDAGGRRGRRRSDRAARRRARQRRAQPRGGGHGGRRSRPAHDLPRRRVGRELAPADARLAARSAPPVHDGFYVAALAAPNLLVELDAWASRADAD